MIKIFILYAAEMLQRDWTMRGEYKLQCRSRISPRRGHQLPGGGGHQHTNLPNFPKNCMKLKEFGRMSLTLPLDPPLSLYSPLKRYEVNTVGIRL